MTNDRFDLTRFVSAQEDVYERALREIKSGRKQSHWMWFVFPQIAGLGQSDMSRRYAISNLLEAKAYLQHSVLGSRLNEISEAVHNVEGKTAAQIFGSPDEAKLKSCMTLFHTAGFNEHQIFERVLNKYFAGQRDEQTLRLLKLSRN